MNSRPDMTNLTQKRLFQINFFQIYNTNIAIKIKKLNPEGIVFVLLSVELELVKFPKATPTGPFPTFIVSVIVFVVVSITETVP